MPLTYLLRSVARAYAELCLLTLCFLWNSSATHAATLTVTSTADGGGGCPGANCTLRDAIAAAIPGDTITFAVKGTIVLGGTELAIDKNLTIQGPGAKLLTISGNMMSRVFNIGSLTSVINVTLAGLTIANGKVKGTTAAGGGIYNNSTGTVNVINSTIVNNSASASGGLLNTALGGGIANINTSTVNVTNSTLANNSALASGDTTSNSALGGGIYHGSGTSTLNVTNSTLVNNSASASGGTSNSALGGGIYNSSGTANATNSTLANNSASASADANGGGFYNGSGGTGGLMTVLEEEITKGGGFYNGSGGTATMKSTIVVLNSVTASTTAQGLDVFGAFMSQGFNLIGKRDDSGSSFTLQPTDQTGTIANPLDPRLGPLADNGGPTQTMALLVGSPAIDKGISNGLVTDQRGFSRILDFPAIANAAGGDGTDIGAYEFGTAASTFHVQAADPAVCLDPNGLVGVTATLTNGNAGTVNANFTATLPAGLTALAGTCAADVNPGGCAIAGNGGSVTWNGQLNGGQTVTIIYRARLAANVGQGAQLTIQNQATVGGIPLNFNAVLTVNCPAITNTRVSDQKAGSLLVFPYYTSTIGGASDTRMTISNISNAASTVANQAYVHLFFIDGTTCQQADVFVCLTPGASIAFKASEYDPGNTGYLLAVAVDKNGVPVQNNVLIGNAFVRTPTLSDNYGAESFAANSFAVAAVTGNTATLFFDQVGYDAVPKQFAVEVQSPLDAARQQVVTAGLSGDLNAVQITGAAQVGTAQAFNEKEQFASFQNWLTGTCQARGTVTTSSPRVPNGLGNLIKTGQAGHLKFNVGAAVGVLLTPRGGAWTGIRTLHKTQTTTTSLTIPIFVPVC